MGREQEDRDEVTNIHWATFRAGSARLIYSRMDSSLQGPDGFPSWPADRLHNAHLLLNEYLLEEVRDFEPFVPDPKWKKVPKREAIDLIEAVLRRLSWLLEHDSELRDAHLARLKLIPLLRVLYTRKLPCTEADLR